MNCLPSRRYKRDICNYKTKKRKYLKFHLLLKHNLRKIK